MGCGASTDKKGLLQVRSIQVVPSSDGDIVVPSLPCYSAPDSPKNLFPKSRTSINGVRTTLDSALNAQEALEELSKGNQRFLSGDKYHGAVTDKIRKSLATDGQSPMAAIIGCADSRVPVEIVFDAQPGDLFVLRNAGNTCMCAEGSIVGSVEYCIGHLRTPLILVMGHTKCGALAGATQMACRPDPRSNTNDSESASSGSSKQTMLQCLLTSLEPPVKEAVQMLPPTASLDEVAAVAIRCNVFHTIKSILKYSDMVADRVNDGSVQIHGAIYDITTGKVQFLDPLESAN